MKPKANHQQCAELAYLLNDGQWHTKRCLDFNERMIRAACEEQPDRFMSSQKGYKLVKFATMNEIDISVRDLRSRARCLGKRADALSNAKSIRSVGEHEITQQDRLL